MKKTMTALVAGIMFMALTLAGCSTQENGSSDATATPTPSPSVTTTQENNLPKITYITRALDTGTLSMYVFTPDCIVKKYSRMSFDDFHDYDLFAGELPPDNWLDEYQISEEEWNDLINTINENNFAELPEDLPYEEAMDGGYMYIQLETSDGVHKSGGYMAGHWDDEENKRFGAVSKKIYEIMETAQELPYHQYQ